MNDMNDMKKKALQLYNFELPPIELLKAGADSLALTKSSANPPAELGFPTQDMKPYMLRDLIESGVFTGSRSKLTLALGKLVDGSPYVADLAQMPHLLIAGAAGTGKSVAINCLIASILYKATPEEVRFILIDCKRDELGIYADIPHLLTPIVADPGAAVNVLRWAINEMENRYKKLAHRGVSNIDQYNAILKNTRTPEDSEDDESEKPLPCLALVINELAHLMQISPGEVETSISRLAARSRAVGIHIILATQRPSADVVTGVIKANLPSRMAFKVMSKVDSRAIIDRNGAEMLAGNGDMLFAPSGTARVIRVHGAYISEKETKDIVSHLKVQGRPMYDDSVLCCSEFNGSAVSDATDRLYNDAVRIVVGEGLASKSLLRQRLGIGDDRAARLMEIMFNNGIIASAGGSMPCEVLVDTDFLDRLEE